MRLFKQWDLFFGAGGAGVTFTTINTLLGCIVALLTIAVMCLRLAREWRDRHRSPKDLS